MHDTILFHTHQVVKWKCCPYDLCKTPVMSTLRYANAAKQTLQDINQIKAMNGSFLSFQLRKQMLHNLPVLSTEELKTSDIVSVNDLDKQSDAMLQKQYVCLSSAAGALQFKRETETLMKSNTSCGDGMTETCTDKLLLTLQSQISDFLVWIKCCLQGEKKLTDQMILDMNAEHRHIALLLRHYRLQNRPTVALEEGECDEQEGECDEQSMEFQVESISGVSGAENQGKTESEILQEVTDHPWKQCQLSSKEKEKILNANGSSAGCWYKCPKGHYYMYNTPGCSGEDHSINERCPSCRDVDTSSITALKQ